MTGKPVLHFIDSSTRNRAELARIGFDLGHHAEVYGDLSELAVHPPRDGIIIARDDPEQGGIKSCVDRLSALGIWLPLIAADHSPQPRRIVDAIKAGALDYLELPLDPERVERCLNRISSEAADFSETRRRMIEARNRISNLSSREREVLEWLVEGSSNKVIARQLRISPRTVEIHRANMMNKLGARHAAEAVRLRIEAQIDGEPLSQAG
ncbi:response regulator transcription factor [Altererythrobacter sp. GH1-8]|uniref:response regulator transcription factor n=1 Tax=Altererythrobacter sp. GH1-8 TaxID=3349333 RepID=UPI00374DABA9